MSSLNWFFHFWNCFFLNMITFDDTNDFISSSKENTDSPWHDVTVDIYRVSPLDTLNLIFTRSKFLVTMHLIP